MNILTSFKDAKPILLALQGFYDLIPVALFLVGGVILLRKLYGKMVKGCYCLLAAGSIMVFSAGFLKALHKVIMGLGRVDYVILDKQFTPTQSIGFLLLFIALLGMFTAKNKDYIAPKANAITLPIVLSAILAVAAEETTVGESGLPAYTSSMPFIIVMIIGAAGFLVMLMIMAIKMKRIPETILYGLAIIFMVGMGYLSTKHDFEGAWYAITCNICFQGCFFTACLLLAKHGLAEFDFFKKKA